MGVPHVKLILNVYYVEVSLAIFMNEAQASVYVADCFEKEIDQILTMNC